MMRPTLCYRANGTAIAAESRSASALGDFDPTPVRRRVDTRQKSAKLPHGGGKFLRSHIASEFCRTDSLRRIIPQSTSGSSDGTCVEPPLEEATSSSLEKVDGELDWFNKGWEQLESIIGRGPKYNEDEDKPPDPKGSIVGAAALIAGSAIGGGILAVPAVTAPVGFFPSALTMVGVWAFCLCQALLLAEVCLAIMKKKGVTSTSMLGMASSTLGRPTGVAVGVMYFLFSNALLVGQLSRGGELIASAANGAVLYPLAVLLTAVATFGLTLVDGGRLGELVNRVLTGLIVATFVVLVGYGVTTMSFAPLTATAHWPRAITIIPYMLQVLNYMNMIPLVCSYLGGSRSRVRKAVISGSLVPLLVCVTWSGIMVGLTDALGAAGTLDPVNALIGSGIGWLSSALYLFAACAVVTSILGTYLALEEFISEALDVAPPEPQGEACQVWNDPKQLSGAKRAISLPETTNWQGFSLEFQKRAVTFVPSVAIAAISPAAFYSAMNLSGTYFVPTIFCLAPPAMAWYVRYGQGPWPFNKQVWTGRRIWKNSQLIPGGRVFLLLLALASIGTMAFIGEYSIVSECKHLIERLSR